MKYQIETGGKKSAIERKGDSFQFNNEEVKLDFHSLNTDTSVVSIGGEMFTVRLMEVSEDKKIEVTAKWHDESHLNKWAAQKSINTHSPELCFDETYPQLKKLTPSIIAVRKKEKTR
jgi:hypothetical protein